jgi:hypothetical protein
MKKVLFASVFLIMATIAVNCEYINGAKEEYVTLPAEGKTFNIKSFNAIKADGVFNLVLSQGNKESVLVKGDLPKGLKIYNDSAKLIITDTCNFHIGKHSVKTTIYVTVTNVHAVFVESVGETNCSDTLKQKTFSFYSVGVGASSILINADTVYTSEEGVGKLSVAGKALFATLSVSGVGALDAKDFKVDVLHVDASGVGAAKVYAAKELYLESDGVGGVQYSGPAKVVKSESSGVGKVEHAD